MGILLMQTFSGTALRSSYLEHPSHAALSLPSLSATWYISLAGKHPQ